MQPRAGDQGSSWTPNRDDPTAPLDPSAAALERIRTTVHLWLDRVAQLAESADDAGRIAKEQCAALQEERDRREREWIEQIQSLEHDRQRLAEAWEKLEREQISALSTSRSTIEAPRPASPASSPSPAARQATGADDSLDRMIMRQFEELRKDVRRTAETRGAQAP